MLAGLQVLVRKTTVIAQPWLLYTQFDTFENAGPTQIRDLRGVPNGVISLFRTTHTVLTTSYVHLRRKQRDSLTAAVYCVN